MGALHTPEINRDDRRLARQAAESSNNVDDIPAGTGRQRILRFDAAVEMTREALDQKLGGDGTADAEFRTLFWALRDAETPGTTFEALKDRGFQVRLSATIALSDPEKLCIRDALVSLAENGSEQLGKYKYIANWIAHVRLAGTRTPNMVAKYIRHVLKDQHTLAVNAHRTTHPLPDLADLSQEDGFDDTDGDVLNEEGTERE